MVEATAVKEAEINFVQNLNVLKSLIPEAASGESATKVVVLEVEAPIEVIKEDNNDQETKQKELDPI